MVEKKLKELEFLITSSRMLNSTLDFDRLLGVIMKIVKKALNVEAASLLFLDDDKKNLVVGLVRGRKDEKVKGLKIPLGEGIAGWVAKHCRPLILNDARKDRRYSFELEKKLRLKVRSSICIPLKRRGRIIGVLEAVNRKGHAPFTKEDLSIFEALGDHVATAVDNARLYSEVKRRNLENRLFHQMTATLGMSFSLDEVLQEILASLKELVQYDAAAILVLDRKQQIMESVAHQSYGSGADEKLRLKLDEGLVGWAAKNKKSIIADDCSLDPRYVKARSNTCSEMVTPMLVRGKVIGLFNLESNQLGAYHDDDLRLLEAFAAHAAISIERARLYEEQRKKLELQREIKVARTVQEFFTPRKARKVGKFYFTGVNYPGRTVSGDYYDFFPLQNGAFAFAIADVAGKGVPASIIMASFRASLHTAAISLVSAKEMAMAANRILLESVRPQDFVTAFIGVLAPGTGEIVYCNAGHNPPVLMCKNGDHRLLEIGGPVLGIFEKPELLEGRLRLDDEILFCYTDGLTEARNGDDEEFGLERALESLRACVEMPTRQVFSTMYSHLLEHVKATDLPDDVTFLVLKKATS